MLLKFIYSEKATEFSEIFTLLLTGTTWDKSKVKILQNFMTFSEYKNFTKGKEKLRAYCFQYIYCGSRKVWGLQLWFLWGTCQICHPVYQTIFRRAQQCSIYSMDWVRKLTYPLSLFWVVHDISTVSKFRDPKFV